jgi:competence protein ComFB
MSVHNLMEEVVKQCLKELIQNHEQLLDCNEKMQSDIMAIALNQLPPKYVSTHKGEMFVKTQVRHIEADVYRELSYAVDKVLNSSSNNGFESEEDNE